MNEFDKYENIEKWFERHGIKDKETVFNPTNFDRLIDRVTLGQNLLWSALVGVHWRIPAPQVAGVIVFYYGYRSILNYYDSVNVTWKRKVATKAEKTPLAEEMEGAVRAPYAMRLSAYLLQDWATFAIGSFLGFKLFKRGPVAKRLWSSAAFKSPMRNKGTSSVV